ncbi:MAG: zf-TFIIB domain-containing protein [Ignavibacteriales bacterium]|jgi:Zn-finger nucleic acid-binding protein|nr:zf-TFIIB domain-containing protein [Ignavibacteriales bacterium]MBP9120561.1 zf-TFIIB domain-containing protein [Ignavibacterium sp.]
MNCPVCNATSLLISERQGVEIDYCPKCRGVWLDRGELDKIIEKSSEEFISSESPKFENKEYSGDRKFYGEKKYDEDYYKRNKKKSFLNDLFDF